MTLDRKFDVVFWGLPRRGNDDNSQKSYDTLEKAEAAFLAGSPDHRVSYVSMQGPGVLRQRINQFYDAERCAGDAQTEGVGREPLFVIDEYWQFVYRSEFSHGAPFEPTAEPSVRVNPMLEILSALDDVKP